MILPAFMRAVSMAHCTIFKPTKGPKILSQGKDLYGGTNKACWCCKA